MTNQLFERAKTYIFEQGRALDQALFTHHFSDGSADDVLTELAAFQNEDGGFGHALEPDIRTPASSVIATAHAFAIFRELKTDNWQPLVEPAANYLLDQYDVEKRIWPIVPPEVELAPHAPWWTYDGIEQTFDQFLVNPRAQIMGCLYDYIELTPVDLLIPLSDLLLEYIPTLPDELFKNDVLCFLYLEKTIDLPEYLRRGLRFKLMERIQNSIVTDPSRWNEYVLRPLQVVSSPDSYWMEAVEESAIEANLDYLIEQQLPDGSWPLPWSWAQVDAAAWAQAEREWKGSIALENLKLLQAFGRIEIL